MTGWSGTPNRTLLTSEERWLAAIGLLWAPFTGVYTFLCHGAGAPAVMWVGSGLMTLYGLWLALLNPVWLRWRRGRQTYQVDGGGLRILGPGAKEIRRVLTHDIAAAWLEAAAGRTTQLWIRSRSGSVEALFVGLKTGSEDELTLRTLVSELNGEA